MQNFVNLYSLSKTLRFELKPVGETAERIEDFKSESLKEIVRQDKKRAEDYKEIKKLIDDYHRYFISEVLSNKEILTGEELESTFEMYTKAAALKSSFEASKTDKAAEDWKKEQKRLREKIGEVFNQKTEEYHLFDDNLVNEKGGGKNKTKPVLWQWIRKRLDRYEIDEQKFAEYEELIGSFNRFSTYFVGFNQNRANIYSKEEQTTAIAYRVVNENMIKFFDNCIKFERIRQNHTSLADILADYIKGIDKSTDDFFRPQSFRNFLAQSDIDFYNAVTGGKNDEQKKVKGINQLINEYRQQNKVENRKLPMMEVLYKQILSDREGSFVMVEAFDTDAAALYAVKECYEAILPETQQLKNRVISNICTGGNLEQIYVKADALTDVSQKIWGDWGLIKRSLEAYSENQFRTKKDKESFLKKDVYSICQVQTAIDEYLAVFDDNEIKSRTKSLVEYFGAGCFDEKIKTIEDFAAKAQGVFDEGQFAQKDENTEIIKNLLDAIMDIVHFVRPLYLVKDFKPIDVPQRDEVFYAVFNPIYEKIAEIIPLYNKVRNYAAKKPYSTEKFKINFESPTLLDGWDVTKETANNALIFIKEGRYYLGIMNKSSNKLFDYVGAEDDSSRIKAQKAEIRQSAIAVVGENYYEKMVYKLLPDPSKMLPKVVFSGRWIDYYAPSKRILEIREKGLHKKDAGDKGAMFEWIDFLKQSIVKHPEWNNYFKFSFSPTRSYEDSSQFYKEVAEQGFCISFDKIRTSYIKEKVESGELYLFEIYSKDF